MTIEPTVPEPVEDDPIITITDARKAGFCAPGVFSWFRRHDLDFKDFKDNGIRASVLRQHGDALAEAVIERKMKREQEE